MTASCNTCRRFTYNPEHEEKYCNITDCPAIQKIPELIVKNYLKKINNEDIDFDKIKIKLEINKKEYTFLKTNKIDGIT